MTLNECSRGEVFIIFTIKYKPDLSGVYLHKVQPGGCAGGGGGGGGFFCINSMGGCCPPPPPPIYRKLIEIH